MAPRVLYPVSLMQPGAAIRSLVALLLFLIPTWARADDPKTEATAFGQAVAPLEAGRFRTIFEPFRTENAALSPDGRHVAYTWREEDAVSVVVVALDEPEVARTRVIVVDDRASTLQLAMNQRERIPGRVLWMRWVSDNRLVVGTNERFLRGAGAILGFNADGSDARKLADATRLPRELASGFGARRPGSAPNLFGTPEWDAAGEDGQTFGMFGLPFAPETDAFTGPADSPASSDSRSLRIFDLDSQRPGAVTIRVAGSPRDNGTAFLDFLSLDCTTGKITKIDSHLVLAREAALTDRQGRPRITLPATRLDRFPFQYIYNGDSGRRSGVALDKMPGLTGFHLSPDNFFGERSIPLGFGADPDILYFASNAGRDTYGIYSYDLANARSGALAVENAGYDLIPAPGSDFANESALVFDRFTHELVGVRVQTNRRTTAWLRPEWRAVQEELERTLPGGSVELLEWDSSMKRVLVAAENPGDPGGFHVYERDEGRLIEIVRRAPWIDERHTHPTLSVSLHLKNGVRIEGLVTIPSRPRIKPIPMVLLCPDMPWTRVSPVYDREVHALAGMGFVVVQLNNRGAWGTGRRQREAILGGHDLVQIEDIVAAVDAFGRQFNVNPERVALLGRGHGGFVALRALQDHPDRFRCAIAVEPPIDLADWLADLRATEVGNIMPELTRTWLGDEARLRAKPLKSAPEKITKPVMLLSYPGMDGNQNRLAYLAARRFAASVRSHGAGVQLVDLRSDYASGLPAARAEVFEQMERFLNLHVYDYKVEILPSKIIDEDRR